MPGLIEEAVRWGLESPQLRKQYLPYYMQFKQQNLPMDAKIQYHPKDIAAVVTLIKGAGVQSYLALDSADTGGHKFLQDKCKIPTVRRINAGVDVKSEKAEFKKLKEVYDFISIDSREYQIPTEIIWKYIMGGVESKSGFGQGAPTNYGDRKISPKGWVLVNFAKPEDKQFYFELRQLYNKAYQSQYCGLIKL